MSQGYCVSTMLCLLYWRCYSASLKKETQKRRLVFSIMSYLRQYVSHLLVTTMEVVPCPIRLGFSEVKSTVRVPIEERWKLPFTLASHPDRFHFTLSGVHCSIVAEIELRRLYLVTIKYLIRPTASSSQEVGKNKNSK